MSTGEMEKATVVKRARSSLGSWASFNRTKSVTPPKDEDLPEFDPENFTPGYVPETVKKGDEEYVIVVSGVPDTGLCGKYWGDMTSLPSRRKKTTPFPLTAAAEMTTKKRSSSLDVENSTSTPKTTAKKSTPSVDAVKVTTSTSTSKTTAKKRSSSLDVEKPKTFTTTKTTAKKSTPSVDVEQPSSLTAKNSTAIAEKSSSLQTKKSMKKQMHSVTSAQELGVEETPQSTMRTKPKESQECSQLDIRAFLEWEPELESITNDKTSTESEQHENPTVLDSEMNSEPQLASNKNRETVTQQYQEFIELKTKAGSSSQDKETTPFTKEVAISQLKSMSSVAVNTPVEVMVDCYARREDHRWLNMGKRAEGMAPDGVQYTRALRPAYHLLSFLRMKGHSSKGMSCTDKNTMVFVVMEGEVSVTIHTTQFNAKKGDSFYVPPKNSYNLINEKAIEAELSLIQFQYDGPLPTAARVHS